MPINNPYGGYLDDSSMGAMSGAGANPYGGFIGALQKQRGARDQQTMADALTQLRKMVAGMPGAPQRETPGYLPPAPQTSDVYSPDDYEKGVTGIESGGNWSAVNPTSGAGGRYQFIEPTWASLAKDPALGLTPEGRTSDTPDGRRQQQAAFRTLTQQNAQILKEALGRMPTHAELYTAHLLGPGWAATVLRNRDTPVKTLVPDSFVKANPFLDGVTGDALLQQFGRKFNR